MGPSGLYKSSSLEWAYCQFSGCFPWMTSFKLIMRLFVIISLLAVAYGRPDVSLGYKYNVGQGGSSLAGSTVNQAILPAPQLSTGSSSQFTNISPLIQPATLQEPLITKQFYIHSAPADTVVRHKHLVLGRPRKNYRVVFIKAPASQQNNVHITAEYAPTEEKTHIFVLSQKEPELNVNEIVSPAPTQPSKPEVFFVKYKTPEEAQHAQQRIQEQYDLFGGTSQVIDEGTAPVSSVIGALGNRDELASSSSNLQNIQVGGVTSSYLPPIRH